MPAAGAVAATKASAAYVPGPGDYDITAAASPGPAYTMAGKAAVHASSCDKGAGADLPGPFDYDAPTPHPGPAYTMAARVPKQQGGTGATGAELGPAAYDVAPAFPAGPAFSMPSGRPSGTDTPAHASPGVHSLLC